MKRFILIAALCVPVAGLATTIDLSGESSAQIFEIQVSQDELAQCQKTLGELRERPVVTDNGWYVPSFMRQDDLPETVCVESA